MKEERLVLLSTFMIGLREGLEAALVVGILVACVIRANRRDAVRKIWWGVGSAAFIALCLGALLTFGRYGLSFRAQEFIGGTMSLIAVAMVTWMVFWTMRTGHRLKAEIEGQVGQALAIGTGWSIFWIAFASVGREGLETTLMLWAWTKDSLRPVLGAILGIAVAVFLGYLLYRGMARLNLRIFFAWTGAFLIILSAGILAYGVHDLQEGQFLPGPFSGAPITPTDFATGEVLIGFTAEPFWLAAYPFGWAFDVSENIDPSGFIGSFLKGTIGFAPQMSWLEVSAWAAYLAVILPIYIRRLRSPGPTRTSERDSARAGSQAQTDIEKPLAATTSVPTGTPPPSPAATAET